MTICIKDFFDELLELEITTPVRMYTEIMSKKEACEFINKYEDIIVLK